MAKVPGFSLTESELRFFIRAEHERIEDDKNGETAWKNVWHDSGGLGIQYIRVPDRVRNGYEGVATKYMGTLGHYIFELRGYQRQDLRAGFGYAVHSLAGTLTWNYAPSVEGGPTWEFEVAEQLAFQSLSLAQVTDAFRHKTSEPHYFNGAVV